MKHAINTVILKRGVAWLLLVSFSSCTLFGFPSAAWAQGVGSSIGISGMGAQIPPMQNPLSPQNIANSPNAPYVSGGDALTVGATTAISGAAGCTFSTFIVPSASAVLSALGLTKSAAGEVQAQGGFGTAVSAAGLSIAAGAKAIVGEASAAMASIAGIITGYPTNSISTSVGLAGNAVAAGSSAEAGAANGVGIAGVAGAAAGNAETNSGISLSSAGTNVSNNIIAGVLVAQANQGFLSCMARVLARAALQSIAIGSVNWINSGFNGNPFYVQNTTQFFRNVADQAAGQVIEGSNLAFLCSPFQLQVQIAVTQAYDASYLPEECSLSDVTSNINGFMSNFSEGSWPAFIAFTDTPSNNPFGAFMYGEAAVGGAVANAQGQQQQELLQSGGFLSFEQPTNCQITNSPPAASTNIQVTQIQSANSANINVQGPGVGQALFRVCQLQTATPGTVVSNAASQFFNINTNELINAQYFDQIISSLVSQLIQNVMYSGLSNISGGSAGSYGAGDTSSFTQIQGVVLQLIQNEGQYAQQLGTISTQNLSNLQKSLQNAQVIQECAASSSGGTSTSTSSNAGINSLTNGLGNLAGQNASTTQLQSTITSLEGQQQANQSAAIVASSTIKILMTFQNQTLEATSTAALQNIYQNLQTDMASGMLPSEIDVANAQENTLSLQTNLTDYGMQGTRYLNSCKALQATPQKSQNP